MRQNENEHARQSQTHARTHARTHLELVEVGGLDRSLHAVDGGVQVGGGQHDGQERDGLQLAVDAVELDVGGRDVGAGLVEVNERLLCGREGRKEEEGRRERERKRDRERKRGKRGRRKKRGGGGQSRTNETKLGKAHRARVTQRRRGEATAHM